MIEETKHCLRRLARFDGRDSRQTFWYYVLALVILQFAIGLLVAIPVVVGILQTVMQLVSSGAPPEQLNSAMAAQMGGMMSQNLWFSSIMSLVLIVLFYAAFVRRLHDAGYSGWLALVPLVTHLFAQAYLISHLDQITGMMEAAIASGKPANIAQMQSELGPFNMVGWLGYLVVIGFGVLKSQAGSNRYGDAPTPV
jgi:uncharacterized membrane protein YhaH (DUF805 family)